MTQRVVLHVGTMKSGTTSLQTQLFASKELLAGQGVLVPGRSWGEQARAVTEVARRWRADGERWSRLVAETAAWPGTSVISMEYLGPFAPRQVAAVVDSLGAARVEVVVTVRDLNRSLVSMWQETVRNGRAWSWSAYLQAARSGRPRGRRPEQLPDAARTFWRQQDVVGIVRSWSAAVGPDAVTVVTVPPPGADAAELTGRFARAVGFSPDGLVPGASANASLGVVSAVLLQRVNARLEAGGIGFGEGRRFRKRVVAGEILGSRAAREPRIGLPTSRWVRTYAAGTVRRLGAEVARLEGAWTDLAPVDVPGADPSTVADVDVATAAAETFTALREQLAGHDPVALPEWPAGATAETAVAALADLVAVGVRRGAPA